MSFVVQLVAADLRSGRPTGPLTIYRTTKDATTGAYTTVLV